MSVVTVFGEIEADALGITLPHEHLLLDLRNQYAEPSDLDKKRLGLRPVSPETIETVRTIMENAAAPAVELAVPLTVDAGKGRSWAEAH